MILLGGIRHTYGCLVSIDLHGYRSSFTRGDSCRSRCLVIPEIHCCDSQITFSDCMSVFAARKDFNTWVFAVLCRFFRILTGENYIGIIRIPWLFPVLEPECGKLVCLLPFTGTLGIPVAGPLFFQGHDISFLRKIVADIGACRISFQMNPGDIGYFRSF